MKREDQAVELFLKKNTCSQSVFIPFCEPDVLEKKGAMKISTIFGSGTGTGLCGTASGALLAISMKHRMGNHEDLEAKTHTYPLKSGGSRQHISLNTERRLSRSLRS
ncbi:MAG: C-GCAxxG-C-C family protein [Betaproteobacteria bacterium]